MNLEQIKLRLRTWMQTLKRYKYTALVLILGILLMCLPLGSNEKKAVVKERSWQQEDRSDSLQKDLEKILSEIEGIGKVSVLLSVDTGFEHVYQQNVQSKTSDGVQEKESETAFFAQDGTDVPLEVKVIYPVYKGAVVVCQGADKASVKLSVVQAVSDLTGLKTDRISVIKMRGN